MKRQPTDLALFGGSQLFSEPLHVGRPNIGDRDALLRRFNDILDRRWLTNNGPYVQEFEREVARLAGVRHCIATANATVGLEIVVRALGMRDEVIVPAFTFVASAHALRWQAINPVFCDIDPVRFTLDPDQIERLITPRTTGIIGVHLWGQTCDVEALERIARRRKLSLVYDAAHAVGCTSGGRAVGGFGDAEVFSFHATKLVNCFEGGAIVTNDGQLARKVRLMKNFGFDGYDNVVHVGTNGKMPEVCAAMGLTSLETLPEFIEVNRRNYEAYRAQLRGLAGLTLMPYDAEERRNFQYVPVLVEDAFGLSRDTLIALLHAENVLARRYFYPGCHRMEPYRSDPRYRSMALPHTERLAATVLCFPTGTAVGTAEIESIGDVLRCAASHAPAIRAMLTNARATA